MKTNSTNNKTSELNIVQKIGICLLVITIVSYYVLSIQFLAGIN